MNYLCVQRFIGNESEISGDKYCFGFQNGFCTCIACLQFNALPCRSSIGCGKRGYRRGNVRWEKLELASSRMSRISKMRRKQCGQIEFGEFSLLVGSR